LLIPRRRRLARERRVLGGNSDLEENIPEHIQVT
jgi:hypothetical protein